jgi:hypothetical protein
VKGCGTINRALKRRVGGGETRLKCIKVSEIQVRKLKLLKSIKLCARLNNIKYVDIRNELGLHVYSVNGKTICDNRQREEYS